MADLKSSLEAARRSAMPAPQEDDEAKSQSVPAPADDVAAQRGVSAPEVGDMLRAAYQQAIEEPVPDDLLDLLNRLQ